MRFAWATDPHLDHCNQRTRDAWCDAVIGRDVDGLFLTGDIGEAKTVVELLTDVSDRLNNEMPIYFVLGNHDFYCGSYEKVTKACSRLPAQLHYLTLKPVMWLDDFEGMPGTTAIVGQDGCADWLLGDESHSNVWLTDYQVTWDYMHRPREEIRNKVRARARAQARRGQKMIDEAIRLNAKQIVFLTHVPPFRESAVYNGAPSDDNWLPFFTSKTMGDMLTGRAKLHPDVNFLVLCGHSHGKGVFKPLPNLECRTGSACYGRPELQEDIVIVGGPHEP